LNLYLNPISKGELESKLGSSEIVVVNVLEPLRPKGADVAYASYDTIHIKGSISVPRSQLEAGRWKELDRSKEIVVHCTSYTCSSAPKAAEFLEKLGFNVRAYSGGIKEWAEAGLPMEGKVTTQQYLDEMHKIATLSPQV
jgi:rhodanese-related sulfurtransferase